MNSDFLKNKLIDLLKALVRERQLPWIDRWFSIYAKQNKWNSKDQKRIWSELTRCLRSVFGFYLQETGQNLLSTQWTVLASWLQGKESRWFQFRFSENQSDCISAGIPYWLEPALLRRKKISGWDESALEAFCRKQAEAPRLYLRFASNDRGAIARQELKETSSQWIERPDGVVEYRSDRSVFETASWKNGGFEVQDASSQEVALNLNVKPGMKVWDVCAGRGGKTLLIAQQMRQKGVVVATDLYSSKMESLRKRANRAEVFNVRTLLWDGKSYPSFGLEIDRNGGFDRILLDAPCSATGTWRRDAEARFRISPDSIQDLAIVQRNLLELSYPMLKPGGRFVYSTCSWLVEENEDIVDTFVATSGARLVEKKILGVPYSDSNTMFVAVWEKPQ